MKPTSLPIALALVATIAAASVLIPIGDTVSTSPRSASAPDPIEGRVDASAADAETSHGVAEEKKLPDFSTQAEQLFDAIEASGQERPSMERMCQDLRDLYVYENDVDAGRSYLQNCRGVKRQRERRTVGEARVVLDTAQLQKAQDCDGLHAKAESGDPVAKYDIVQLWGAGLCRR